MKLRKMCALGACALERSLRSATGNVDCVHGIFFHIYRPQMKFAKVFFLHVSFILSMGGGLPQCIMGYPHPRSRPHPRSTSPLEQIPQKQTPPQELTSPQEQSPQEQTPRSRPHPRSRPPQGADTPLPGADTPCQEQTPAMSSAWEIQPTSQWYASYWNA